MSPRNDLQWQLDHDRAIQHEKRTMRMYTNFLRVAKQLWVPLPGTDWTEANYEVILPEIGTHVSEDYSFELRDLRRLNLADSLTASEASHLTDIRNERRNRSAKMRNDVMTETWTDTVNLSL